MARTWGMLTVGCDAERRTHHSLVSHKRQALYFQLPLSLERHSYKYEWQRQTFSPAKSIASVYMLHLTALSENGVRKSDFFFLLSCACCQDANLRRYRKRRCRSFSTSESLRHAAPAVSADPDF